MNEYVRITDVSPRDGLQNERGVVPTEDKAELIRLLCASGVDEVEATSFVSPKWVPQLGDAKELLEKVRQLLPSPSGGGVRGEGSRVGRSSGRPSRPALSVLVPNEKGFERALEVHSDAFPLKIAVFTAASETFSRKNTNASVGETIERFRAFVPRALEMGMDVRMYVSCAIACPYEGPIEPARVRDVVDQLSSLAPAEAFEDRVAEIDLGDTIGAGTADSTRALLGAFEPGRRAGFVLHLHDTRGTAAECIGAGLEMGVRHFDGSVAGLGGCPYAGTPEKPAPGNVSTETVVRTVEAAGFATFVDLERLGEAAACARRIVGAARAAG